MSRRIEFGLVDGRPTELMRLIYSITRLPLNLVREIAKLVQPLGAWRFPTLINQMRAYQPRYNLRRAQTPYPRALALTSRTAPISRTSMGNNPRIFRVARAGNVLDLYTLHDLDEDNVDYETERRAIFFRQTDAVWPVPRYYREGSRFHGASRYEHEPRGLIPDWWGLRRNYGTLQ